MFVQSIRKRKLWPTFRTPSLHKGALPGGNVKHLYTASIENLNFPEHMSAPCSRVPPSPPCWFKLGKMATSKLGVATRAFAVVLLALARSYNLVLSVGRDSSQDALLKAYRKVLLKVHPDKGGNTADVQTLQSTTEIWDSARTGTSKAGRP